MSDTTPPTPPGPAPTKPAIIVADDHALFRAGLRVMLHDDFPDYEVIEAPDLEQALERASTASTIALFVIDLAMPGMDGAASLAALCDVFPETAVAVMTGSDSRADVVAALDAGVLGFIPKTLSSTATKSAIAAVLRGETYVPARLLRATEAAGASTPDTITSGLAGLTPRQQDVIRLLAKDLSTEEIARALSLGERTVKVYLAGLYRALGVGSRLEALIKARQIVGVVLAVFLLQG